MNTKVIESKPKLYQIYLDKDLQTGLEAYISDNYTPDSRVTSATIRAAVMEFLKKRGYYGSKDQSS